MNTARRLKSQRGRAILFVIMAAAMGGLTRVSRANDADANAYIANAPISGVPPGTFSQWTNEQKINAYTRIGGFCRYLCVDAYGNTAFPNTAAAARAKAEAKVCLAACIVNHLPLDYPQLSGMMQDLRADFEEAKKLGSTSNWPLPRK